MSRTVIKFRNKTNSPIWFQTKVDGTEFPTGHVTYTDPYPDTPLEAGDEARVASIGDPGFGVTTNTGSICFSFATIQAGVNPVATVSKGVKGHQAEGEISGLSHSYRCSTENTGKAHTTDACSVTFIIEDAC